MRKMTVAGLASQTLIYGTLCLWLLSLLPAAVVTALKDRWPLFLAGWLTLGLTWIVGAVSIAAPASWWAQRLYGEKKLAQASDPVRHRRPRSEAIAWAAAIALAIGLLGVLAARPSPILGIDGPSLQHSVGGSLLDRSPCVRLPDGSWECAAYDHQLSGQVSYRVEVDGLGCWTATRAGAPGEGSPRHRSGCVTVIDHILG
jgi:hypothetical protein